MNLASDIALLFATREEAAATLASLSATPLPCTAGERFAFAHGWVQLTGVGPERTAVTTRLLLDQVHPGLVINAGIAGALLPDLSGLAVVSRVTGLDESDRVQGAWTPAHHLFRELPRLRLASVIQPVEDAARRDHLASQADLVDMEGATVAELCHQYRIPCLLLKAVSDQADEQAAATILRHLPGLARQLAVRLLRELGMVQPVTDPWPLPADPVGLAPVLGAAAHLERRRRFGRRATYVHNLQINPTNLCRHTCRVCGFRANPGDRRAYLRDHEEILAEVARVQPREIHMTGGISPAWPLHQALELVRALRRHHPRLHIKAFTAVEIHGFGQCEGLAPAEVLRLAQQAGVDSLPGGGAEIFAPRIRQRFFPDKIDATTWLAIHRTAHGLGLTSQATLLFGLGETWQERWQHLVALRQLQQETGGFQAFVPLPLQRGGKGPKPSPLEILMVVALARLVLDNIPHIKAYWPMTGLATASLALGWGADDLDGTLGHERIAHASGAPTPTGLTPGEMDRWIREAGFEPVAREGDFQPCGVA